MQRQCCSSFRQCSASRCGNRRLFACVLFWGAVSLALVPSLSWQIIVFHIWVPTCFRCFRLLLDSSSAGGLLVLRAPQALRLRGHGAHRPAGGVARLCAPLHCAAPQPESAALRAVFRQVPISIIEKTARSRFLRFDSCPLLKRDHFICQDRLGTHASRLGGRVLLCSTPATALPPLSTSTPLSAPRRRWEKATRFSSTAEAATASAAPWRTSAAGQSG
jgi:hypothetical protein